MALGSSGPQKADINITPMIDVLLVLIIIFMVIAPLREVGLNTIVPEPPSKEQTTPRLQDIVVTVQNDGLVFLNQERVALSALPDRFRQIYQARGECVIFLRGDRELAFSNVAEVVDLAKGAGLGRVALMTR